MVAAKQGRTLLEEGNAAYGKVVDAFRDVQVAEQNADAARKVAAEAGKVGITGFCWGGVVTWASVCRLDFQAAACYYGGGILPYVNEQPNGPTILHFGEHDAGIPLSDVDQIAKAHPECPVYIYDADHGFHCDMRGSFNPHAAQVASVRTFRLFDENLTG